MVKIVGKKHSSFIDLVKSRSTHANSLTNVPGVLQQPASEGFRVHTGDFGSQIDVGISVSEYWSPTSFEKLVKVCAHSVSGFRITLNLKPYTWG